MSLSLGIRSYLLRRYLDPPGTYITVSLITFSECTWICRDITQTLHGTAIYAFIDPQNHPWPDRQSYGSPISRVWVILHPDTSKTHATKYVFNTARGLGLDSIPTRLMGLPLTSVRPMERFNQSHGVFGVLANSWIYRLKMGEPKDRGLHEGPSGFQTQPHTRIHWGASGLLGSLGWLT